MTTPGTVASNIRPENDALLLTAAFVKTNFLFGVDLTDDFGAIMPDSLIEFYIRSAQAWLSRELGIILHDTKIVGESHDHHYDDYTNFGFVKLLNYPVRKVSRYALKFPLSDAFLDFDPKWFRINSVGGQVNLIPAEGTFSSLVAGHGGSALSILGGRDYLPYIVEIDYECGFEADKVPADMLEIIGMKAAMGPLNIAGDLIAGAGIATKSISIDGLSQSVGTTSSATNAGYGARIIQYNKEIDSRMATLRTNIRGISMVVA